MRYLLFISTLLSLLFSSSTAVEWEEIKCDVKAEPTAFFQSGDTIYIGHYGIAKSTDGGKTFKKINKLVDGDREYDLADEGFHILDIYKTSTSMLLCSSIETGLLYSTNDGDTWQKSNISLSQLQNNINSVFVEIDSSLFLLKLTSNPDFVLYKSDDSGMSWSHSYIGISNWKYIEFFHYLPDQKEFLIIGFDKDSVRQFFYYNPISKSLRHFEDIIPEIEEAQYFGFENQVLAYDKQQYKIYKYYPSSGWELFVDLVDKTEEKLELEDYEVYIINIFLKTSGNDLRAYISFQTNSISESDTSNEIQNILLSSPDFGKYWVVLYKDSKENTKHAPHNSMRFNTSKINNIVKYRKYDDIEIGVIDHFGKYSPSFENVWYSKNNSSWETLPKIPIAWPNFDGSVYTVEGVNLNYYENFSDIEEGKKTQILDNMPVNYREFFHTYTNVVKEHYINGLEVFGSSRRSNSTGHISIKNNKLVGGLGINYLITEFDQTAKYLAFKHSIDLNVDSNYKREILNKDTFQLVYGDIISKEEIILDKTIKPINSKFNSLSFLSYIALEKDVFMISHIPAIELSRDKGKTWTKILSTPKDQIDFKIHEENIYLRNRNTLLRSHNGKYWENLLEGTSKARIIDFEFDPDGHAYAYTTNGAFISKEPIEDSGKAWNEEDIDLEFKIASDKNSVEITSKDKIKNVTISDWGKLLKKISENTYDISELETVNYFLRVEFEDGKVVYKQLALEK